MTQMNKAECIRLLLLTCSPFLRTLLMHVPDQRGSFILVTLLSSLTLNVSACEIELTNY